MKRINLLVISLCLIMTAAFAQPQTETTAAPQKTYTIGVSKMVSHPALDAIEQGMQDYMATTGIPVKYDFQNCNGEVSTAASIAQKFKSDNDDIVVGIATPPAQALALVFKDRPVIFGAISDPLAAGLVSNYDKTEDTNVCGVSDMNPIDLQLKTFFEVAHIKKLGMVYTSGEANGVAQMEVAKQVCADNGVEFISAAVSNSAEVKTAALSIIDRVDGMYVAIDNTVVSAIASVDEVCYKAKKPLFNTDTTSSENTHFFMSWGFNYYTVGVETGKVIERVIKGEKPRDIGAIFFNDPSQFDLMFNLDSAKYLGIDISDEMLKKASYLVKDNVKVSNK
ncbi:MAG: ABC transporter substrate-binding protein [Sphaerochaeta sp.]|jgi:putative ABC transport system substrate-binding protein|nr:ABC transporter substrate-binding protein [Sphaerochaeta sp.]MCH3919336.1 ABC transporter substrate-binding protein [Sphaerochaeta sp.]MCI2075999.1 ABC transporter substrate-binding protein [Sphaerochaeta sp.]MCI2097570.1 ABC transporter substrate-binding protein [Sphaerochaeta sp.]MCI2104437.1 ABC transporter substrate-binding protein [Sphaerochaeta sp.]